MNTVERIFRLEGPEGLGGRPCSDTEQKAVPPSALRGVFVRESSDAVTMPDYAGMIRLQPGEKSTYAALLGSIPAEVSDEEFEAALAIIR